MGFHHGLLTLRGRLDLLQRVVDQGGVVGLGEIAAEQLRGDHQRQVDRFAADLLQGAVAFLLDLLLGVLRDALRLLLCLRS